MTFLENSDAMQSIIVETIPMKRIAQVVSNLKKKSVNSIPDFKCVLDSIEHYWIYLAKKNFPNSSSLSTIYYSFKSKVSKVVESKNRYHFY